MRDHSGRVQSMNPSGLCYSLSITLHKLNSGKPASTELRLRTVPGGPGLRTACGYLRPFIEDTETKRTCAGFRLGEFAIRIRKVQNVGNHSSSESMQSHSTWIFWHPIESSHFDEFSHRKYFLERKMIIYNFQTTLAVL